MKRLIALLLCLVLVLSLCACKGKNNDDKNGGENNSSHSQEGGEGAAESTKPLDITTLENYYQDLSEPEVVADQVSYKIFQAWYDNDALVLDLYIINGHDAPITELWFDELSIYNGDVEVDGEEIQGGLISSACVGPVELKEPVPAGSYSIITMYMPKDLDAYLSGLSMDVDGSYIW